MTLYFDTKVELFDSNAISTIVSWHPTEPLFAVASFSQERGGSVTIFSDTGEPQRDVTSPVHAESQAQALAWHPARVLLASGWENGDIHIWLAQHREFASVQNSPHKAPILFIEFSEQGGRMVSADASGLLTGWRCDGQYQFLTMFSHDLRDALRYITFRRTIEVRGDEMVATLAKAAVAGDELALDVLTNWRPRTAAARNLTHAGVKDNHCFYAGTQTGLVYYINQAGTCSKVLESTNANSSSSSSSSPIAQMLWHPKKDAVVCLMEDMTVTLYLVEATGILTELDRVKLSGRAASGQGAVIAWAASSLAIITGDLSVRIWDMDQSDNYLLKMQLPNAAAQVKASTSLASSPHSTEAAMQGSHNQRRLLGAGKQAGGQAAAPTPTTLEEAFSCLAYCAADQILCAGTTLGNVYTWRRRARNMGGNGDAPAAAPPLYEAAATAAWQLTNITTAVRGAVRQCVWGVNVLSEPCILANGIAQLFILKEQPLLSCHARSLWAVQQSAKAVYVQHAGGRYNTLQTEHAVTALALNDLSLVVSSGRHIATYSVERVSASSATSGSARRVRGNAVEASETSGTTATTAASPPPLAVQLLHTFVAECQCLGIQNQSIFCLSGSDGDIVVYSIGGVVLNKIQASDSEGKIIGMDLCGGAYLSLYTMNGYAKAYDVTRHEPRLLCAKSGHDLFPDFGEFMLVKCNSAGTHLAAVIANRSFVPLPNVYCWDFERGSSKLMAYCVSGSDGDGAGGEAAAASVGQSSLPVRIFWDTDEPRLFAVEVKTVMHQQPQQQQQQQQQQPQLQSQALASRQLGNAAVAPQTQQQQQCYVAARVLVLFYTAEAERHQQAHNNDMNGLQLLESRPLDATELLINMCVPHVVTLHTNTVQTQPLQDFVDLEEESGDARTRQLVLSFSLHVAAGNMDLAYRCIRALKSPTIWTNLARMCVQTGRLDVAMVCMGHLGRARSVRALRQALHDDDLEPAAKVAALAIELGMCDKAQQLYKQCSRSDLLNQLLQCSGQLDQALVVAESEDRVHLKNTYYQKAQALRESGDIQGALAYYEKTQNPVQHITQLLLDSPMALKRYMQATADPKMLRWWGQYIESSGDMDAALAVYQKADDWFSQVKILCYLGQIARADAVARQSGDRAACYHLARHYEKIGGKCQEAIMFYTRAQTFGNAIRICKDNDCQDELWTVAGSARARDKAIAAAYFEECGAHRRAVELYHRAGMLHKAIELAFESQQPDVVEIIAAELTADSDPELIQRCADFFINVGQQHQKAVQLLAKTRHVQRALRICTERGVPITEELAELLTPQKQDEALGGDEATRRALLTQLGELLQQQGDYHAATKKFTLAGDKVRAMKSLLKSGNTDKIIYFASMSRQREVYVMAANYLQALKPDASVLKHIVAFYSKGQAYDSLANFYAICAQTEIEEYHDYEKALAPLCEAAKCLEKLGPTAQQAALANLQRTIGDVKAILQIQEALNAGDNQSVIAGCRSMLIKPELPPIRHTDVLAMLARAFAYTKQYSEAAGALKELAVREPSWSAIGLVDKALVQRIAKESHLDFDMIWKSGSGGGRQPRRERESEDADDGDNEEEIQEDLA